MPPPLPLPRAFLAARLNDVTRQLPAGWTTVEEEHVVYEWRCPKGAICGMGQELLYKKHDKTAVIENGVFHLFSQGKHSEFATIEEAREVAKTGVIQRIERKTVYYDQHGVSRKILRNKSDTDSERLRPAKPKSVDETEWQFCIKEKHSEFATIGDAHRATETDVTESAERKFVYYQGHRVKKEKPADKFERDSETFPSAQMKWKHEKGVVIDNGAWHPFRKGQLPDLPTIDDALEAANTGLIRSMETETSPRKLERYSKRFRSANARREPLHSCKFRRPTRSRSRRQQLQGTLCHEGCPTAQAQQRNDHDSVRHSEEIEVARNLHKRYESNQSETRQGGPRPHEVGILRVELDEIIDSIDRSTKTSSALGDLCVRWAEHAAKSFRDEQNALRATKGRLERFRRA